MGAAGGGGIFISYRRQDKGDLAGRLADHLIIRFGAGQVFIDVEAIRPGVDFAEAISQAVDTCTVLVAVIGPGWLAAVDERGRRRLDDPADLVRLEIGTALAHGVAVIPVLAEDAVMPGRRDLPEDLAGFDRRNALRVRLESFRSDAGRLIETIEEERASASAGADWAARLFGDAERIARSITDKDKRASALARVAQALAGTDPDRAARLFGNAERIANSITPDPRTSDLPKTSALGEIAEALADTDPGRAMDIANSIAGEYEQALVLARVAQALAGTDRDRAVQLVDDAERIARSLPGDSEDFERIVGIITNKGKKALALAWVGQALAGTDRDRAARLFRDAERTARSLTDEYGRVLTLAGVAEALAGA